MRSAASRVPVEDGRLGPQRGVPRPPHAVVPVPELLRWRVQQLHRRCGQAPVQQQQRVEELAEVDLRQRPSRRRKGVDDIQPGRSGVVVPA